MNSLSDELDTDVETAAKRLLGCYLVRYLAEGIVVVKIVETEAYDELDEASHAHRGQTMSNAAMFGPAGRLYVYFTYGMHYCCNVVTGAEGSGAGVLIRAVEPIEGVEIIEGRRGMSGVLATNGPAKLTKALNIDKSLGGHDLTKPPLQLVLNDPLPAEAVVSSVRIGISKAKDNLKRFYIRDNQYVSKL